MHSNHLENESAQLQIQHLLLPTAEQTMRSRLNSDIELVIKEEGSNIGISTGGLSIGIPPDSMLYSSHVSSSMQSQSRSPFTIHDKVHLWTSKLGVDNRSSLVAAVPGHAAAPTLELAL